MLNKQRLRASNLNVSNNPALMRPRGHPFYIGPFGVNSNRCLSKRDIKGRSPERPADILLDIKDQWSYRINLPVSFPFPNIRACDPAVKPTVLLNIHCAQ